MLDSASTDMPTYTKALFHDKGSPHAKVLSDSSNRTSKCPYRCLLRVLDSFGTHAEFNLQSYFLSHKVELGGRSNPWGGSGLELQQFMTMYPHTDDNTFLGFVVETHDVDETLLRTNDTLVGSDLELFLLPIYHNGAYFCCGDNLGNISPGNEF